MEAVPRQGYFLGKLVKSVKKGVKGLAKGVKKFAKSDLGKAALLGAAAFGIPGTQFGGLLGRASIGGAAPSIFGKSGGISALLGGAAGPGAPMSNSFGMAKKGNMFSKLLEGGATLGNTAKVFGGSSLIAGMLAKAEEGDEEAVAATRNVDALRSYLEKGARNLRVPENEISKLVEDNVAEYTQDMARGQMANGGRIGYAGGTEFEEYLKGREEFNKKQNAEQLYKEFLENKRRQKVAEQKTMAANGGRIGYAFGTPEQNAIQAAGIMDLPLNKNPAGVTELDLRETGGFIPPVGVKEKADDIPAMLANNEFVFTADAVRGMGDGNVNKGAQRMYDMMKKLEKGGRV
jgi:hypothetical protein